MKVKHHPRKYIFICILLFFCPGLIEARDMSLEKELQGRLKESRIAVRKAKDKKSRGKNIHEDISLLKVKSEEIKEMFHRLQGKFKAREEEIKKFPEAKKALSRHKEMVESFNRAMNEYLDLIKSISDDGGDVQDIIERLDFQLEKILHKKKLPIHGNLPYRNPDYSSIEPNQEPAIKPAYKGGNKAVSPDDTKSIEEAPISEEIAGLAQSLNWDPVLIYEYVKNNVETEWYWGCMKGAEETLRQKSGNDCDQAALLIALLRASGFPSRYVRGVIEFFAGSEEPIRKVKNLTGIEDPWKIGEFFREAGIPYRPIISGGKISNFQIEHIWVESQIPYANYRGAIIDEHGKRWLGLDTSIKVTQIIHKFC
ncbi:MAG: transglutaminase domain-containing protein [Nitrospirota bacterium]